jgi:hypothetical protein
MRSQDMKDTIQQEGTNKTFIPQGGKETKFPQKPWIGKDKINEEIQREIRRKKFSSVANIHGIQVIDVWEKVKSITLR